MEQSSEFYKNDDADLIWWIDEIPARKGYHQFGFDKKKVFNLFRDYPHNLTPKQKEIFDKENPYWANFFSNRQ